MYLGLISKYRKGIMVEAKISWKRKFCAAFWRKRNCHKGVSDLNFVGERTELFTLSGDLQMVEVV